MMSDNSTISTILCIEIPLGILADTSNSIISRNLVVASELNATYPGPNCISSIIQSGYGERSVELLRAEIGGIIVGGEYNVIYSNTVKNSHFGLVMMDMYRAILAVENLVFHNNFINNTRYQIVGTHT